MAALVLDCLFKADLRRFYYDTIGYSDDVLDYLVRVIGADRILMGSDYCFPIAYERPLEIVTRHPTLTEAQKYSIAAENAKRLLRLDGESAAPMSATNRA